jgi:hypothetical protein
MADKLCLWLGTIQKLILLVANQEVGKYGWILNVLSHLTQIPPVEVEENENG